MRTSWSVMMLCSLAALMLACQPVAPPVSSESGLEQQLQTLVSSAVKDNDGVHGAALAVQAPGLGLQWAGAAGLADPDNGVPMTAATPVRIASNTKTYVAAAALRLWEDGRLGLDDPIAGYLPAQYVEALSGDGYDPDQILVRHLLTHTSGLFDHSESATFEERILADPQHRWTRTEQVMAAVEWGEPLAGPGQVYSYCDTGYVLLGEVIEQVTGQTLAAAVRELVDFSRLGLDTTWWETMEPVPEGVAARAHQYLGEADVTGFDPSFDLYGGGGLAVNMIEMERFYHALLNGEVFRKPETLTTMLSTIDGIGPRPGAAASALAPGAYRMGLWEVEVAGYTAYRHTGFWGTLATHIPELDITVACTVNQNQAKEALMALADRSLETVVALMTGQQG